MIINKNSDENRKKFMFTAKQIIVKERNLIGINLAIQTKF